MEPEGRSGAGERAFGMAGGVSIAAGVVYTVGGGAYAADAGASTVGGERRGGAAWRRASELSGAWVGCPSSWESRVEALESMLEEGLALGLA